MPWQRDYSPKQIARITQACNETPTLGEKSCVSVCSQLCHSNKIRNTTAVKFDLMICDSLVLTPVNANFIYYIILYTIKKHDWYVSLTTLYNHVLFLLFYLSYLLLLQ